MFEGSLLGMIQFLVSESPLKMMKHAFYFTLKAIFVLEIFALTFLYAEKWLVKKAMVNFKFYDVTDCKTNIYSTHITQ